jgi:hypothetical protein
VDYLTLASSSISGAEETTWLTNSFDVTNLFLGTNLFAVEVHQNTNTSSDLLFNLEASLLIRTNHAPTVSLISPTSGQIISPVPGRVTVTANASDPKGGIDNVELWQGGTLPGVFTNSPCSLVVSNLPMNFYTFSAIVTDDRGARGTSAPVWVPEPSEPVFPNGQWRILVPFDSGPGRFYRLQSP